MEAGDGKFDSVRVQQQHVVLVSTLVVERRVYSYMYDNSGGSVLTREARWDRGCSGLASLTCTPARLWGDETVWASTL
jgi:hypothetical protein